MRRTIAAAAAALLSMATVQAGPPWHRAPHAHPPMKSARHWVGTWSAAQQLPEPPNQLPPEAQANATLRQTVHLSVGGPSIRLRISNAYGAAPLHLTEVHVARPVAGTLGAIDPGSDRTVTFGGHEAVVVPAGADYLSDPLPFPVAPLSDLTVTIRYDALGVPPTGHPGSRATSFVAPGDQTAATALAGATGVEHWYILSGVEVAGARASVVTVGDSTTDGRGSTTNGNDRWPDDLARRIQADPATRGIGVLNAGIGGNRVLLDDKGPNALARFDRDGLAPGGVHWLILLEGINDLGTLMADAPATPAEHAALVARLTDAYRQIVARAHAHGIKVMGATLPPWMGFTYYRLDADSEADRMAVNAFIRTARLFDAVADFDAALRDPAAPDRLRAAFDSGDHLHPSPAGYRAMAEAIPLSFFRPATKGGHR